MANFTTHIAIGTVASGLAATLVMAANIVTPEQILTLAAAGTLGSVLPDVDLKDSRPSQAMFSSLAVFMAFAVLFNVGWRYSIAEMWVLWAATYVGVRYVGGYIFHRLSYHRGIYHSLLAGAFFSFVTTIFFRLVLDANETVAWIGGGFMMLGYLVHLTLDEMYSVDVFDRRVKASFGTALKLFDYKHLGHSAVMAAATVAAFLATPPLAPSWKVVMQPEILAGLHDRLLPKQGWFGFLAQHKLRLPNPFGRAAAPEEAVPVEAAVVQPATGTLPALVAPPDFAASPVVTGSIGTSTTAVQTATQPQALVPRLEPSSTPAEPVRVPNPTPVR